MKNRAEGCDYRTNEENEIPGIFSPSFQFGFKSTYPCLLVADTEVRRVSFLSIAHS